MKPSTIRAVSGLLALGVVSSALDVAVLAPSALSRTKPALSRTKPAVELRLRQSPGRVDVVIAGIGTEVRAVSRSQSDGRWSARLTGVDLGDRPFTPQQQLLSSSELLSVRLEPLESDLQLIVKARMGERVPTPTIGSNGDSLVVSFAGLSGPEQRSSGRLDLRRPGRVAQPVMAPPMRPRAVAPPLGDMAVGTMLINNRSFVNASGPPVSLTLNQAPAKDALMSLARLGGYGFVFVGDVDRSTDSEGDSSEGDSTEGGSAEYPVTMTFRGERYARALNSVLMASGLQGRLDGKTLLVGTAVATQSFGPQMSKVFRMNQVDVESAGAYLGNLGATVQVAKIKTKRSEDGWETDGTISKSSPLSLSHVSTKTEVETYGSGVGPLLGLVGTTDQRLNTITLVGDPKLISIAESYLKQIDLRKRQVAVKVQILNIDLLNNKSIDTSFSAQIGDTFLVSESGKAFMNFGSQKPGNSAGTGVVGNGTRFTAPGSYRAGTPQVQSQAVEDPTEYRQPQNSFMAYVEAVIESKNAKTLATPTLLVQEGNTARVRTGTSVITDVTETIVDNVRTISTSRRNAGLTLSLDVAKIDDNGFITLSVNPEVSVPEIAGERGGIIFYNITERSLNSGTIRLRDRQTLVLTGVIQDKDREIANKWPILGDLPFLGSLFRKTTSSREKNELVILVTPSIVDDNQGGSYGYGYRPSTREARQLLGTR